ncbi:MAG: hypothetical protein ACRDTA_06015 [Pseudonocardiaceae bacterium]
MNSAAVLAARYRPGLDVQATHPVHLIPLPFRAEIGLVSSFCGSLLCPQKLETVKLTEGTRCSMCVLQYAVATQSPITELPTGAASPQGAGPTTRLGEAAYCALDWPVHLQGDRVVLPLGQCATAQIMPVDLIEAITPILTALDRPMSVLVHPDAAGCGVVIAGEPYGVPLPWPETVQVVTGMLALPPSRTPQGPVGWYHQAPTQPLANCREIDVFAAVRTAEQAAHWP